MDRQSIAVDVDGVIHSYRTKWEAAHILPDEPVAGAINWLLELSSIYDIAINSTRCNSWRGRRGVKKWLQKHVPEHLWKDFEKKLSFHGKPQALVYVDDRAWRFDGTRLPSLGELSRARPWWKFRPIVSN